MEERSVVQYNEMNLEIGGVRVPRDELTVAKINAAVKILEWSKDDIEPGIGGTPNQLHVALADAFRNIFKIVSEAVGPGASGSSEPETEPEKAPV
jgi:hypothetical protein